MWVWVDDLSLALSVYLSVCGNEGVELAMRLYRYSGCYTRHDAVIAESFDVKKAAMCLLLHWSGRVDTRALEVWPYRCFPVLVAYGTSRLVGSTDGQRVPDLVGPRGPSFLTYQHAQSLQILNVL